MVKSGESSWVAPTSLGQVSLLAYLTSQVSSYVFLCLPIYFHVFPCLPFIYSFLSLLLCFFLSTYLAPKGFTPFFAQALDVLASLSKDQVDITSFCYCSAFFANCLRCNTTFLQTYLVVAGHTGVGVYPESSKQSNIHLSISQVPELQEVDCN